MKKVLQIIHLTDMHVGAEGVSAHTRHVRERNRISLLVSRLLESRNVLGWYEGTQTHIPGAPEAFTEFLQDLRARDSAWFDETETWLVDTGDLTTFGDPTSIREGKRFLQEWARILGAETKTRGLYGNHDAWPATQPATTLPRYFEELHAQQTRLWKQDGWRPQEWLKPLRAPIPRRDKEAYIELYALDSVDWDGFRNFRAVGRIDPEAITQLQDLIEEREARGSKGDFRILATHHPIAFPYDSSEVRVGRFWPDKMRLANAGKVARRLSSQTRTNRRDPYIHLMLAGHVHARYPGGPFNGTPSQIKQKDLKPDQLQLVASSLMFNRVTPTDDNTARLPASMRRTVDGFDPVVIDPHTSQADILRFSLGSAPDAGLKHDTLILERTPIVSVLGTRYFRLPSRTQFFRISHQG